MYRPRHIFRCWSSACVAHSDRVREIAAGACWWRCIHLECLARTIGYVSKICWTDTEPGWSRFYAHRHTFDYATTCRDSNDLTIRLTTFYCWAPARWIDIHVATLLWYRKRSISDSVHNIIEIAIV